MRNNDMTTTDEDELEQVRLPVIPTATSFSQMEEKLNRLSDIVNALPNAAEWKKTVKKVARSVVSIHFCVPEALDTATAHCGQATGFVVVADAGIG
jgi:hypothetical protein